MSKTIVFKDYVAEQIRQRYAPTSGYGADNEIIHKLSLKNVNLPLITRDFSNIYNPNLLFLHPRYWKLGVKFYEKHRFNFVPKYTKMTFFKDIVNQALAIDTVYDNDTPYFHNKQLYNALKAIKKEKLTLVVIGYGGAMSNFLWNLSVIAQYLSVTNIFKKIVVYEKESLTFTNILRIGKPVAWLANARELEYIEAIKNGQEDIPAYRPEKFTKPQLLITNESILAREFEIENDYITEKHLGKYDLDKTIFIGAPDFETREMLYNNNAQFFMMGHANNRVQITKNPYIQNSGIVNETYGTIEVPKLLMNLQLATAAFIQIASQGIDNIKDVPNDTLLWAHDFDEQSEIQEETQEEVQEETRV